MNIKIERGAYSGQVSTAGNDKGLVWLILSAGLEQEYDKVVVLCTPTEARIIAHALIEYANGEEKA